MPHVVLGCIVLRVIVPVLSSNGTTGRFPDDINVVMPTSRWCVFYVNSTVRYCAARVDRSRVCVAWCLLFAYAFLREEWLSGYFPAERHSQFLQILWTVLIKKYDSRCASWMRWLYFIGINRFLLVNLSQSPTWVPYDKTTWLEYIKKNPQFSAPVSACNDLQRLVSITQIK